MIIKIRVKPESREQKIEKISDSEYEINLKERAEDNKANIELLKLLKRYFNKQTKIIKGFRSRNKVIKIQD